MLVPVFLPRRRFPPRDKPGTLGALEPAEPLEAKQAESSSGSEAQPHCRASTEDASLPHAASLAPDREPAAGSPPRHGPGMALRAQTAS